jgi:hypothetical protein
MYLKSLLLYIVDISYYSKINAWLLCSASLSFFLAVQSYIWYIDIIGRCAFTSQLFTANRQGRTIQTEVTMVKSRYPDIETPKSTFSLFCSEGLIRNFRTLTVSLYLIYIRFSHGSLLTVGAAIFRDGITDKTYTFADVRQLAEDLGKGLRSQYDLNKGDVNRNIFA